MNNERLVNAWIDLSEDQPENTTYDDSTSSFQRLKENGVYKSVDILNAAFFTTIPTSPTTWPPGDGSSYTLSTGDPPYVHPTSGPKKLTNEDYLNNVIRDARASNPNIKILATLVWGQASSDPASDGKAIANIFPKNKDKWQDAAKAFASNLIDYLDHYRMDGFDIDWEPNLSTNTDPEQFALLLNAIGVQKLQSAKRYYLTLSPSTTEHLNADAVKAINNSVDFINLQLYFSEDLPQDFTDIEIDSKLFAYGAKFEKDPYPPGPVHPTDTGHQAADGAYEDNQKKFHYDIFTCWRLNSGNYIFEQDQQQALYKLVFPATAKKLGAV